ncbi:MAG: hypothetical protein ACO3TU_07155, partial [Burkholderiaceae bacterium]
MSGWGRVNPRSAHVYTPRHGNELAAWVQNAYPTIARGLGRSYGDSAVAEHVLAMQGLDWPDGGLNFVNSFFKLSIVTKSALDL